MSDPPDPAAAGEPGEIPPMHKYPEYTYTSYDKEKPSRRTGILSASLLVFVSFGFLIGLALLAARNWYLFS